jgi:hypothetical protein
MKWRLKLLSNRCVELLRDLLLTTMLGEAHFPDLFVYLPCALFNLASSLLSNAQSVRLTQVNQCAVVFDRRVWFLNADSS